MDRCWILVGMMGSGKSSVGRALAEKSEREFKDTDLMLQQKLGRPIPQIFSLYGEDAFREHETSILKSLQPAPYVLATGGGIVGREENWSELRRLGHVIYLHASFETLQTRLESSKKRRPLLEVEGWEERLDSLLTQRKPLYERADITVAVDGHTVEHAASLVWEALQSK